MLQHQDEEPYAGILDNFRQQMSSEQTEVFKQLSGNQQHTLLLYLNEVVTLHLEKEDVIKPNYHVVMDCLIPVYPDETFDMELPEWCIMRYAEDIIKNLIEIEQ
ncbi:uncharacterized protein LOC142350737 [Convolutriloba macropyga]|uniref:uncharacterized protein LOC142350737 n=1 Tax=Convolutriloba macropyga TaxID=536237 RepID=UPI003F51AF99